MRTFLKSILLSSLYLGGPAIAEDFDLEEPETTVKTDVKPIQNTALAKPNAVLGTELNTAQKKSVQDGLDWLASKQNPDGSYGDSNKVGITAIAGLAFMQQGSLPGRGKYGTNVQLCMEFILDNCQPSGLISTNDRSPMYGHGFAAMFLGEIYGMTANEDVKEKLTKAIHLIQKCQNPQGGWRYQPAPDDADISVTICEIMALRSARDAGIKVEKSVIDNAIKYVKGCQNPDGGFCYQLEMHGTGSGYARSAAGVAALYYAGVFEGKELENGLKYLSKCMPGTSEQSEGMYFYANYYGVQAMFLAGGEYWSKFYPALRDQIIERQKDQHWSGESGDEYATSMALIILQMPNRYLPVYTGKGPGD